MDSSKAEVGISGKIIHSPKAEVGISGKIIHSSKAEVGISGKIIHRQAREIIANVVKYFEEEKQHGALLLPVTKVRERTVKATGVSRTTVSAISRTTGNFSSPGKTRNRSAPVTGSIDEFDLSIIRHHIHDMYCSGEFPSLRRLQVDLKEKINFSGCPETLRKILKNLGFQYRKCDRRKFLLERNDVIAARLKYLRTLQSIDASRASIYLDETWVNENHTLEEYRQDDSQSISGKVPTGKGRRLIILHAGNSNGFIPNSELILISKENSADFHQELNPDMFLDWFKNQLLPNIPPKSYIFMDNAPCHSRQLDRAPTSNSSKQCMRDWLIRNKIAFNENSYRPELYEIIKQHKSAKLHYEIDEMASSQHHTIIRIPPYHCEFNPIEFIWAQIKGYVALRNNAFDLRDVEKLVKEAISMVTADNWSYAIGHVEEIVAKYKQQAAPLDEMMEKLTISNSLSDNSSSESEDDIVPLPSSDED